MPLLPSLVPSLVRALRSLARTPGFTAAAILTLALGMGGAITFFGALHGAVLRTPPYPGARRIHRVVLEQDRELMESVSALPVREMAAACPEVEALGVSTPEWGRGSELETGAFRERIPTAWVDPPYLDLLGARPALGSGFQGDPAGRGVLLTYGFWKARMGGDPGVVGRTLPLVGGSEPILGVLPEGLELPFALEAQLVRPLPRLAPDRRGEFRFTALLRLKRGVDPRVVEDRFRALAREQEREDPSGVLPGALPRLVPLGRAMAGTADRGFLLVCAAAALLLLLATANVASLFLDRADGRSEERAIRLCLGATRGRLLLDGLPESLLVSLLASGLGFLFATQSGLLLRAWLPGGDRLHGLGHAFAHPSVAAFALVLLLVQGLALGVMPLWSAGEGGAWRASGALSRGTSRARRGLVATQMALATVLLFGAGLLGLSLRRVLHQPTGIATGGLVVADLELRSPVWKPHPLDLTPLLRELRARPGIAAAAMGRAVPTLWGRAGGRGLGRITLQNGSETSINAAAGPEALASSRDRVGFDAVSEGYVELLGLGLLQGRTFTAEDLRSGRKVCILDRKAARRFFPEGALGRTLHLGLQTADLGMGEPLEVIGVVESFRAMAPEEPGQPFVLLPAPLVPPMRILLRSSLPPGALRGFLAGALASAFPEARLRRLEALDDLHWERALQRRQVLAVLLPFSGLALLLAALGLGALVGSQVSRRTRELGIRSAVGATPGALLGGVLGRALRQACLGILGGLGACLVLSRFLASMLYGVEALDGAVLTGVLLVLGAVALLAALLPALRAARIHPSEALRAS